MARPTSGWRKSVGVCTIGTATEIFDHLRLLFAKVGETFC